MIPESCRLLSLKSRCFKWEGLDFRAETRAAQLISDNLQFFNLNKGKKKTDKVINNSNSCLLFHFHDHWWRILDSNGLLCKEINLIHKSNNWDISRNKSNPIEMTLESPVYSLNSPEQHIAASMLNPSGGFHSDPALSDGKGWTSGLRPQFHSELLRANS